MRRTASLVLLALEGKVEAARRIEGTAGRPVIVWDSLSYVQGPDGKTVSKVPERYIFDARTRATSPIHHRGTRTFRGLTVYRFEQTVPWTEVRMPKTMPVRGTTRRPSPGPAPPAGTPRSAGSGPNRSPERRSTARRSTAGNCAAAPCSAAAPRSPRSPGT